LLADGVEAYALLAFEVFHSQRAEGRTEMAGDGLPIAGSDIGREEGASPGAPVGFQGAEGGVHDPTLGLLALLDCEGGQAGDEEGSRGLRLRLSRQAPLRFPGHLGHIEAERIGRALSFRVE
jgi:hypothetical protein